MDMSDELTSAKATIKQYGSNQVWYVNGLEVLGPLRYHLGMLIQRVEEHNAWARRAGQVPVPTMELEEAKVALNKAEDFFTNPQQKK